MTCPLSGDRKAKLSRWISGHLRVGPPGVRRVSNARGHPCDTANGRGKWDQAGARLETRHAPVALTSLSSDSDAHVRVHEQSRLTGSIDLDTSRHRSCWCRCRWCRQWSPWSSRHPGSRTSPASPSTSSSFDSSDRLSTSRTLSVRVLLPVPVMSMRSIERVRLSARAVRSRCRPEPSSSSVSVPLPPSARKEIERRDAHRVVARAALEGVRAALADHRVVAGAADEGLRRGGAGQRVVAGAAQMRHRAGEIAAEDHIALALTGPPRRRSRHTAPRRSGRRSRRRSRPPPRRPSGR